MIGRFVKKLSLPPETKVVINSVTRLTPPPKEEAQDQKFLELYHVIRDSYSVSQSRIIVDSIIMNGFRESIYGNKGRGVYLSSHSSYGLRWIGASSGMLVCYVKCDDPSQIKRCIAEIPPGFEYVARPHVVLPGYFIDYNIVGPNGNQGWLKLGKSGCHSCDKELRRCDCAKENPFHPEENIVYWQ